MDLSEGVPAVREQSGSLLDHGSHHRHIGDSPDRFGVFNRQGIGPPESRGDVDGVAAADVVAGPHHDDVRARGPHVVGHRRPRPRRQRRHGNDRGHPDHQTSQREGGSQRIRGQGRAGGPEGEGGFHGVRSLRVSNANGWDRVSKQTINH